MKKSLLLSSALLVGVGAFAQTNRYALGKQLVMKKTRAAIDVNASETAQIKPIAQNSTLITSTPFTASRNGFGMLVEETVPLSYNQDLNMVAFTMRIPPTTGNFAYATTGITTPNSGHMITHYSTDNGTTWNRASLFTKTASTVNGALARYPSGVIANAPGNTDPAQARFVGTGPCTDGSGWMANWFASRPANETGNTMLNDMQVAETAVGSGSVAENTYFSSYCTTTNGTDVWTGGYAYEPTGTDIKAVAVYKGIKGPNGYIWSRPIDAQLNNFLDSNYFSNPKIAFSPNGQIGYILINGVWATNTGNAVKSYQPQVWKTIDGGNNWTKVNDNYDWKTNHPEILGNLMPTRYASCDLAKYPAFFDSHGGEITVDNNGKLHYVTTVVSGYSSHPDSLGYTYGQTGFGYAQFDNLDKPWVWDFTTDGNGNWDSRFISYLYTRNISTTETVGTNAFWTTDGAASLDYNNRIKVSRSNDGSKIFITWTDSDTTSADANNPGAYIPNHTPSIYYRGMDVASGNLTPIKEASYFDAAEGGYYLYQTSEIAMPNANGFTIPTIYISSSDGSQNATNAVDFNYISDLEVLNSEYTEVFAINTSPVTETIADSVVTYDLAATLNVISNATCYGLSNGSATITASNGAAPYSFTWLNLNSTSDTLNNLSAGEYNVRVKDSIGCFAFANVTITQPDSISLTSTTVSSSCGDSLGSISINAVGGTGAYSYLWNNISNTSSVDSLPAGIYDIEVKDANNCAKTITILLVDSGAPVLNPTVTNVTCNGSSNGSISANATGGNGTLTYVWTGGLDSLSSVTGIAAGSYTLTVKDSLNCSSFAVLSVDQPAPLAISLSSTASCFAQCSGTASSIASGGLGTYAYSWSNQSTSSNLSSLCPGSYILTLKDSADLTCLIIDSITVLEKAPIDTGVTVSGFGVVLTSEQPAAGATFKWIKCSNNQQVSTSRTFTVTSAMGNGDYKVVVTFDGCSDTSACIVVAAVGLNDFNQSAISKVSQNFPNPFATTSVVNVTLNKAEVITVNVTNLAGQVVLSKVVKGNAGVNEITVDAASLESGIYFYNVVAGDSKVTRKMSVVK